MFSCDVGLQRLLKLAIRDATHSEIVRETVDALESGISPEDISNDQRLPTLRNRSANWILQGYNAINHPEIAKKAFSLCAVPGTDFNLSCESLTSRAARQAIPDLRETNHQLYIDITAGQQAPVMALSSGDEADNNPYDEDEAMDDTDRTIEEMRTLILGAQTAEEAGQALGNGVEFDEDAYEGEDDSALFPIA